MEGRIRAEWDTLKKVIVHKPGIEMFFGLLDPHASLYERAFSQNAALKDHDRLVYALREQFGVKVEYLLENIKKYGERDDKAKKAIIDAAIEKIDFVGDSKECEDARKELKENIDTYDIDYFLNIIMLMPRMVLRDSKGIEAIHINVTERDPLSNLYFMRDQQAITDKGIFLSRMSKPQRRNEPDLTKMLWKMMKLKIVHESTNPGTFEGGDFMPMKEFALVGMGDRTNRQGVEQMLKHGLGFGEVGIVHQPAHPLMPDNELDPMVNMHLDTYFNVAGSDIVLGSETLLKKADVEVYQKEGSSYTKSKKVISLFDYMKSKGFRIINLSTLEQLSYASNFLCIRDHSILAVNSDKIVKSVLKNIEYKARSDKRRYGALFRQAKKEYLEFKRSGQIFPHKKDLYQSGVDIYAVDLKDITGGYGGAHCMTAAIERR
ncbi:arginine deiminase family protein [Candidatus Marsarchaeota archaeon]|nr:arginine deiminase family protein [Candidatus Marsarchaeota archaeon]